jgi:hypothetical protein
MAAGAGIKGAWNTSPQGCLACPYSKLLPFRGLSADDGRCGTAHLRCPNTAPDVGIW